MLKAQLAVSSSVERREQLGSSLDHLNHIQSQLAQQAGDEDLTFLTVKLHLLNDPGRFLTSRLLDPHCLGYKWPFGGLVFTFTAVAEISEDEVRSDHIYLDSAVLVGAGWDSSRQCLTKDTSNRKFGKIRGVPTDKKQFSVEDSHILVPVYSSRHSGELARVPVGRGDLPREFWQRRNIYVRIE